MVGNNHLWFGSNKIQLPQDTSIPSGIIAMWSGASNAIPTGWVLCNGQNGTPDLRNRFIVGAGSSYSVGNTGGSDTVSLNTNQIPAHSHGFSLSAASAGAHTHSNTFSVRLSNLTCSSAGSHTHTTTAYQHSYTDNLGSQDLYGVSSSSYQNAPVNFTSSWAGAHTHTISGSGSLSGSISSGGDHTHSVSGSISNSGGGQAHENRPPYYALCFIMKV